MLCNTCFSFRGSNLNITVIRVYLGTANSRNTPNNTRKRHQTQNNLLNTEIHMKYITLCPLPCQIINCFKFSSPNYKNYEGSKIYLILIKI